MKKILSSLLLLIGLLVPPAVAVAGDAPVILTHRLTSSLEGSAALTLYFTVHLQNPGDGALTNLALSFVPLPPFSPHGAKVSIGNLGPHQSTDFEIVLQAPPQETADAFTYVPLTFAGKFLDAQGRQVEFPAISNPSLTGGAK